MSQWQLFYSGHYYFLTFFSKSAQKLSKIGNPWFAWQLPVSPSLYANPSFFPSSWHRRKPHYNVTLVNNQIAAFEIQHHNKPQLDVTTNQGLAYCDIWMLPIHVSQKANPRTTYLLQNGVYSFHFTVYQVSFFLSFVHFLNDCLKLLNILYTSHRSSCHLPVILHGSFHNCLENGKSCRSGWGEERETKTGWIKWRKPLISPGTHWNVYYSGKMNNQPFCGHKFHYNGFQFSFLPW